MKDVLDGMEYLGKLDKLAGEIQDWTSYVPVEDIRIKVQKTQRELLFPETSGPMLGRQ